VRAAYFRQLTAGSERFAALQDTFFKGVCHKGFAQRWEMLRHGVIQDQFEDNHI
jgi:hypothetical protein